MSRSGRRSGNGQQEPTTANQGGLRPKYRRGFGCVTWVYMGILTFLAAATLFALPLRYVGDGSGFGQILSQLSFFGLILFLPSILLGFALGTRTYRVERSLGAKAGALVGAIVGWGCFFVLCWSVVAYGLGGRDQLFRPTLFAGIEGSLAFYAFAPLMLAATALVLYGLFAKSAFELRRRLVLIAAALALLAGLLVVAADLDSLGVAGALVSTVAGTIGGWVAGVGGYARAGGDEMIPPGSTIRPRGPRRKLR